MPYIIIILMIAVMYVMPFEGFITLTEDERTIMEMYSSFETNDLDTLIDDTGGGLDSMLSDESDFNTLSVLGDLGDNNGDDQDFEDVDISNYM